MKLPSSSNSRTGGAALSFWSARTVLGRCRIQAWPCSSIETLDTWPQTHLLGSFGQVGSTSKRGTSRICGAGACAETGGEAPKAIATTSASAVAAERMSVVMKILPCSSFSLLSLPRKRCDCHPERRERADPGPGARGPGSRFARPGGQALTIVRSPHQSSPLIFFSLTTRPQRASSSFISSANSALEPPAGTAPDWTSLS